MELFFSEKWYFFSYFVKSLPHPNTTIYDISTFYIQSKDSPLAYQLLGKIRRLNGSYVDTENQVIPMLVIAAVKCAEYSK